MLHTENNSGGVDSMQIASPEAFILLLFIPFMHGKLRFSKTLPFVHRRVASASRTGILFSTPVPLQTLPRTWKQRWGHKLNQWLSFASFLLLVVALSRPQMGVGYTDTVASGRDIILALDVSGSMRAIDFTTQDKRSNRLTALQEVMQEFVQGRTGDRIGLVVYGAEAFTLSPLTLDHHAIMDFIQQLEIGMAGTATAIGDGLVVSLKRLKDIAAESKVIVLATDGKNNAGVANPKEAAILAKSLGIRVHVVGIGGVGPAPFVGRSFFGTEQIVSRDLEYDEAALKEIAAISGGEYFLARDTDALRRIYDAIDKLEERKEENVEFVDYEERFLPFLILGFFLFVLSETLGATILLRIP